MYKRQDYITPAFLGGKDGQMIGNSIVTQFGVLSNWPLGSAITFFVVVAFLMLFAVGGLGAKKLGITG